MKTTRIRPRPKRARCPKSRKVRFPDHDAAVKYLHAAANARQAAELDGAHTLHREVRTYWCGSCGGWHVTSQSNDQQSEFAA